MDFRPLTLNDCQPWAMMLAASFNRPIHEMEKILAWLHDGYPIVAWGAWDKDKLAAQYSCLITHLHLPECDQHYAVGMSINMATHPDYRGRGLIKQVSRPVYETIVEQGAIAGVGFSNADGVRVDKHSKGYGYRVVGQLLPCVSVVRDHPVQPLDLSETLPYLDTLEMSYAHIQFISSPQTIAHRFARHPFRRYRFGVWRENGHIHGVVVYRQTRLMGLPTASLLAAYSADLPELLVRFHAALAQTGIRLIHTLTTPASMVRAALQHLTLTITTPLHRTPYYLTAKSLQDHTPLSLFDFGQWDSIGGKIL